MIRTMISVSRQVNESAKKIDTAVLDRVEGLSESLRLFKAGMSIGSHSQGSIRSRSKACVRCRETDFKARGSKPNPLLAEGLELKVVDAVQ